MAKAEIRNFIVRSTSDGGITFKSDYHRGLFKQLLKNLFGKDIWLTIDDRVPKRSDRQNRFYWLYLGIISDATGHTTEELHEYFKDKHLRRTAKMVFGKLTVIKTSTTDLGKLEFGEYIDKIHVETNITPPDASIFGLAPLK